MQIKRIDDFTDNAGTYEISFAKDEIVKASMEERKREQLETDDYYGPSFGMDASYFCEVYRRIYNRITGGAYMNGPRLLVYTNKDIFDNEQIYNDKVGRTVFYETVLQFHELSWYKPIIDLIVCMVARFENVDLSTVKSILQVFEITEDYTLDQLCQDTYEEFISEYEDDSIYCERMLDDSGELDPSEDTESSITIPEGFDIFNCNNANREQGLILDNIIRLAEKPSAEEKWFTAWMKPIVNLMGSKQITSSEDIDQLIEWVTDLAYEDAFRAKIREDHLVFLAGDEPEAMRVARSTVSRQLGEKSDFRYRRKCLGILKELNHVDIDTRVEKSLEILAGLSEDMFSEALDLLLGYVERHLAGLIGSNYRSLFNKEEDIDNTEYIFIELERRDAFLDASEKVFEKWISNGLVLVDFVSIITSIFDGMNPEEGVTLEIDSIVVSGVIALYVSKDYEKAIDYIISNNKYVNKYGGGYGYWYIYHVWHALVARCFYHVENLEKANILLGIINEYTSETEKSYRNLIHEAGRALNHISREKEYLRSISFLLEYYGHSDDIEKDIYADGGIETTANEIRLAIQTNRRIAPNAYMDAFRYAALLDINKNSEEYSIIKWHKNEDHSFLRRYEAIEYRIVLSDIFFTDTTTFINFCEMYDQQNGFIECAEDRQLLVSGDLLAGIKTAKLLSTKRINLLQDQSLEETITSISELKHSLTEKGATDDEILTVLEDIVQDLSERSVIKDSKWEMIKSELYNMEVSFYESHGMEPEDLVGTKLSGDAETFWNYLITSERVFRYLSKSTNNEKADYSAALISMTKAIELILNCVYRRAIGTENADELVRTSLPRKDRKFYLKDGRLKENLEIGPLTKIFTHDSVISQVGEIEIRASGSEGLFNILLYSEYIDVEKLKTFNGHAVIVTKDSEREEKEIIDPCELTFGFDADYNKKLLGWGLDFIREKYRNKTAHNSAILRNDVEDCKKLLVQGECLLWILLYIIK